MRVGVLELLKADARPNGLRGAHHHWISRQYASIMPQAVSVWCRQLGHHTFYATYYGQADPLSLLPDDLDVVFITTYTSASPLAYALARALPPRAHPDGDRRAARARVPRGLRPLLRRRRR